MLKYFKNMKVFKEDEKNHKKLLDKIVILETWKKYLF
jgi:hypothetical protein